VREVSDALKAKDNTIGSRAGN